MLQPVLGRWVASGRLLREHGGDGGREVGAGHGFAVARPRVVELPAIGQLQVPVEEIKVRRAGGEVGLRDGLRLVVEIGETPAVGALHLVHFFRTVGGIARDIVGVDGHEAHAFGDAGVGEVGEGTGEVKDEGAVIADECHHQPLGAPRVTQGDQVTVGAGQGKIRRHGAGHQGTGRGDYGHAIP